ncbi:MAG: hypothetical protein KBC00_00265 [Candidatus Levybacteria bacterium]|nr:hypothetical protein [Candidatus Levybacteria bacterium]MBP9815192.1 hypothetical protein [Candidatus Levybacteria bacterium]
MSEQGPQIDKLLAKVQTRRDAAAKTENPDITTDRRPTRENTDVPRSPTTRLIRGSLTASLKDIKNDPQMRVDLVPGFVSESRKMAEDLDKLDVQFHKSGKFLDAGKGSDKKNSIYAVTLDLREPSNEPDTRTPWVMIGGAYSTSEQNAALSMALALQGEKVMVVTHPEQMRDQEGRRGLLDLFKNTAKDDIGMFKNALVSTGFSKVNLLGDSVGGAFALALASDSELTKKVQIENAIILQPVGFEKRTQKELMTEGNADEKRNVNDPEAKVIMALQGNTDAYRKSGAQLHDVSSFKRMIEARKFISSSKVTSDKLNDSESIARAVENISGELEIWSCGGDGLARPEAIQAAINNALPLLKEDDKTRLYSYNVTGAHHNQLILNAFGFMRARFEEQEARRQIGEAYKGTKTMDIKTMERSGAEYLLKKMQSRTK